jgi:hypothetical protein
LGVFFRGKDVNYKAGNVLFKSWKESVLAYWRYIFLEGQRKTAEYFSNVAHVTAVIRIGKFPNASTGL